jgi:hypothetical protein
MIQRRHSCILIGLAMLPILIACGIASSKKKAESAVTRFHERFNRADFEGIWVSADDSFRRVGTREQYDKLMRSIHGKLGRVVKSTLVNWSIQNANLTSIVVLVQSTEFEHGTGTESFAYVTVGDDVKLNSYHIESSDLVAL